MSAWPSLNPGSKNKNKLHYEVKRWYWFARDAVRDAMTSEKSIDLTLHAALS